MQLMHGFYTLMAMDGWKNGNGKNGKVFALHHKTTKQHVTYDTYLGSKCEFHHKYRQIMFINHSCFLFPMSCHVIVKLLCFQRGDIGAVV